MSNVALLSLSTPSTGASITVTKSCPTTQIAVAGGFQILDTTGVVPSILASYPTSVAGVYGWTVTAAASTQSYTLKVWTVCANVPTQT